MPFTADEATIRELMDDGGAAERLRALDPACGQRTVRAQIVTGLADGLRALLGPGAAVTDNGEQVDAEAARVLLGAGPHGCVACVATAVADQRVDLALSVDPTAVRQLAGLLELPVAITADAQSPAELSTAVDDLLRSLEIVVTASSRLAADRLHDGPLQELTVAQLLLESTLGPDGVPTDPSMLQRGVETLRQAIGSSRALMNELMGETDEGA